MREGGDMEHAQWSFGDERQGRRSVKPSRGRLGVVTILVAIAILTAAVGFVAVRYGLHRSNPCDDLRR